jgi:hypothetical protein
MKSISVELPDNLASAVESYVTSGQKRKLEKSNENNCL